MRQSELSTLRAKEAKELAAKAERDRLEQAVREKAAQEAAHKEYIERTKRAADAFVKYHQTTPGQRGMVIGEYMRARGFTQDQAGLDAAVAELNDPKFREAVLGGLDGR